MSNIRLVVHCHFYQPPRENPWTEEMPRELSAAPFHDWNERITAECYRPNGRARIVDERGLLVSIVNNYERLSFDVGPTLASWLVEHHPEVWRNILAGDALGAGAIAQPFFHVILPLATERDVRTQIRWGVRDFVHRFGRVPAGIWLPETAVNDTVLALLVEEGIRFTVLAPTQAGAVRPLGDARASWKDVGGGAIDTGRAYRWVHPDGEGALDVVFYDGGLSHSVAFELSALSSELLLNRVEDAGPAGGSVVLAADGETFGHHHVYGDRLLAYALSVEAGRRGMEVVALERVLDSEPVEEVAIAESAWSCAHGVGRWGRDCGCSTGGEPGWNQQWRAPLRDGLNLLRDTIDEVFERRGKACLRDPWDARDAYVDVLIGAATREEFAREHVVGDAVEALTLLELARQSLAMFTSCGWFFNDLAGLETVQILRYAARALDLLEELGEEDTSGAFLERLAQGRSNVPFEGDGLRIWNRHVRPARVTAERAVAHLALLELLEGRAPGSRVGIWDVDVHHHSRGDRGTLSLSSGRVSLTHRRTGRRTDHVFAALRLGGLEVLGAIRTLGDDNEGHEAVEALEAIGIAFASGAPVTHLIRLMTHAIGPHEFGLDAVLPEAADQILEKAAAALANRFARSYEELFTDHRSTLVALAALGYPLPPALRAPAEIALARRLETEITAQAGSLDPRDYERAVAVVHEAAANGVVLESPGARAAVEHLITAAVIDATRRAVAPEAATRATRLVEVLRSLELHPSIEIAQEVLYEALTSPPSPPSEQLLGLARALGLAVASLGQPS